MAHEQTPDSSAQQGSGSEPAAASGVSRRRALLRAGSAVAPVLLTLASGPVGATGACTVASSYVSAATFKSRGGTITPCVTKTCNDWYTLSHNYSTCDAVTKANLDTKMNVCHPGANLSPNPCATATMLCKDFFYGGIQASGTTCVLQHMTALKLGGAQMPTTTYLTDMWNAYKASAAASSSVATFTSNGITWTEAQLIDWLKKLQGLP